jgi:hypothetical protein
MYRNQILGLFIIMFVITVLIIVITYQLAQTKDILITNQVQILNNQKELLTKLNETNSILTNIYNK